MAPKESVRARWVNQLGPAAQLQKKTTMSTTAAAVARKLHPSSCWARSRSFSASALRRLASCFERFPTAVILRGDTLVCRARRLDFRTVMASSYATGAPESTGQEAQALLAAALAFAFSWAFASAASSSGVKYSAPTSFHLPRTPRAAASRSG